MNRKKVDFKEAALETIARMIEAGRYDHITAGVANAEHCLKESGEEYGGFWELVYLSIEANLFEEELEGIWEAA